MTLFADEFTRQQTPLSKPYRYVEIVYVDDHARCQIVLSL